MSEDQKGPAYERAAKQAKVVRYVRSVIGWPLLLLVSSGLYFGVFQINRWRTHKLCDGIRRHDICPSADGLGANSSQFR